MAANPPASPDPSAPPAGRRTSSVGVSHTTGREIVCDTTTTSALGEEGAGVIASSGVVVRGTASLRSPDKMAADSISPDG
eukprot:2556341-Prorocentrum_lima.AAC.1